MDEAAKAIYRERYEAAKEQGVRFFPEVVLRDLIVAATLLVLLVGLAAFAGVAPEPRADPNDPSYVPRPEWYFLWLFQLLKYVPGRLEWIGTAVFPLAVVLLLLLLPFYDRNPARHWRHRRLAITSLGVGLSGFIGLTVLALVPAGPAARGVPDAPAESTASLSDRILLGQQLYGMLCADCHGTEGEGGEILGVAGLEGVVVAPLSAPDFILTRSDDTIYNIIEYGQPELGMPASGTRYGGAAHADEMQAIVDFMRHSWDDRAEMPPEAAARVGVPSLAESAVPSYEGFVDTVIRRACISCHRPGRENGNYLMRDYRETLHSGDNAPNVIAGDLQCNLIRMIRRETIDAGGPMPPTSALKEDYVDIFVRWVTAGMPRTDADAAAAGPAPTRDRPLVPFR